MLIKYTLTPDDLLAWYKYWHYELSGGKRARSRFGLTRSAIFLGLGLAAAGFTSEWAALAVGIGIVGAIACPFYFRRQYDAHVHAQFGTFINQLKPMCGPHELTISEQGFCDVHPLGESRLSWNAFSNCVTEDGRMFAVLIIGSCHIINSNSYSGPVPFNELPAAIEKLRPATTS